MKKFELNKEEQDIQANKLQEIAIGKGYEAVINRSRKTFGDSTYVYVAIGNYKWKVRFSDHQVGNYDRMWNELHSFSAESAMKSIEAELIEKKEIAKKAVSEYNRIDTLRASNPVPKGYEVFVTNRTYQNKEEFLNSRPTAIRVFQKKLNKDVAGKQAYYYEYIDVANGYGSKNFSIDYLNNIENIK